MNLSKPVPIFKNRTSLKWNSRYYGLSRIFSGEFWCLWFCSIKSKYCISKDHFISSTMSISLEPALVVSSVWKSVFEICPGCRYSSYMQCWPSQLIWSYWRKAKHLSLPYLYYVVETSTPRMWVVPDHTKTPPSPHKGLYSQTGEAMKL